MRTYNAKDIHKQLLEAIWGGVYLERTLNLNEVIEDLVSYLSTEEAKHILRIYRIRE